MDSFSLNRAKYLCSEFNRRALKMDLVRGGNRGSQLSNKQKNKAKSGCSSHCDLQNVFTENILRIKEPRSASDSDSSNLHCQSWSLH